jgi:hypothetical protein
MRPTDDLTSRGALMVVRALTTFAEIGARGALVSRPIPALDLVGNPACEAWERIRSLSASDAALARAIDAVPGRG